MVIRSFIHRSLGLGPGEAGMTQTVLENLKTGEA